MFPNISIKFSSDLLDYNLSPAEIHLWLGIFQPYNPQPVFQSGLDESQCMFNN